MVSAMIIIANIRTRVCGTRIDFGMISFCSLGETVAAKRVGRHQSVDQSIVNCSQRGPAPGRLWRLKKPSMLSYSSTPVVDVIEAMAFIFLDQPLVRLANSIERVAQAMGMTHHHAHITAAMHDE